MRYRDLLRVWECGHSDKWSVELNGEVVAILVEPQYEEMFWTSYRVVPSTDDAVLKEELFSDRFWKEEFLSLAFRNCESGLIAQNAIPTWHVNSTRLSMRALYVSVRPPMPWDWVVLLFRRLLRLFAHQ